VALTAHAMKDERERCLDAGFDEFLSKPLQRAQLIELLQGFAR
jgi:CheY-like chemotaxis protein